MIDFDALARWPLRSDGSPDAVLVGALLVATAPLVVPAVFLAGYVVRLLRTVPAEDDLPTFGDVGALADDGLRASGVGLAYFVPAVVLLSVGLGAETVRGAVTVPSPATVTTGYGYWDPLTAVIVTLGVVALLPCSYLASVAVTEFAATDRLAAAFDPDRIRRRALSTATVRAWLAAALVAFLSGIVAAAVAVVGAFVPGAGPIVAAAVRFYGAVVAVAVWCVAVPDRGVTNRERSARDREGTAGNRERSTQDRKLTTPERGETPGSAGVGPD